MTLNIPTHRINLPIVGGGFPVTRYRLQLAAAIVHADWQQRARMEQHEILMATAQARAEHLANIADADTITPAHATPEDGRSANEWLRDAGYLPDWYPIHANTVESWVGGYKTVEDAIAAWLDSEPHRRHVQGVGWFYGEQTWFGVGVVLEGRYSPSYCFLSSH